MDDAVHGALRPVELALDRIHAEQAELGLAGDQPPPSGAWHPDPDQHPVTTRQWAEVTRLRASALRLEALQVREEAAQLRQATRARRAWLRQPHPGAFIWVGPAILMPPTIRDRW